MPFRSLLLILSLAATAACAQPSRDVVDACVRTDHASASVRYAEIPVHRFDDAAYDDSDLKETTIRVGKEKIGTWESASARQSGLVYNGRHVALDNVTRLAGERPEPFDPYRAMWGIVRSGAKSYFCITFNFGALGHSGPFQSVRGVYLFERHARVFSPLYAVSRVTPGGVVLAK